MSDDEQFVEWFRNTHTSMYNSVHKAYEKYKEMKK
jgi:hypothetical protein|tara:strand:+ start:2050 stop:2154 length:105 start_codon:yes stop_codon:yes gene_type:complete